MHSNHAALEKHMGGATAHLTKLEGFCKGPYMCGGALQSGDFHVFEMIDQHEAMAMRSSWWWACWRRASNDRQTTGTGQPCS